MAARAVGVRAAADLRQSRGAGVVFGVTANLPVVIGVVIVASIVAFLVLAALQATMQGVYCAALYRYATNDGASTPGFDNDMLALALKPKG